MSVPRNLVFLGVAILVLGLCLSNVVPLVHTESAVNFVLPCTTATYGNAWDGDLAFGLFQTSPANGNTSAYLVVMKTNGTVQYLRQAKDQSYFAVKNIANDTLMFQGEPNLGGTNGAEILATHFWNYVSNTTQDFPNVDGHHDIEYNPIDNTFLTLQSYVRDINGSQIQFDKIVEFSLTGDVLWSWDTYNYIPLSEADPLTLVNGSIMDFTHANALDWDYNNNIIYLNLRHTNTFYKINQTTGDIIWACGEFGNFTLLNENGKKVTSLWYHSHDTRRVEPNVFSMFDNDFHNETNPSDCHSRLIEVTIDENTMTAWVSWNWSSPKQYWSPYWGKTDRLPNGDRIGVFGTPTHQYTENQPWTFNDTGAVVVEVSPAGQVVRTYTFPTGWGIYRVEKITKQSISPPPSSNPKIPEFPTLIIRAPVIIATLLTALAFQKKRKHAELTNTMK
jgi:hypothetical protein